MIHQELPVGIVACQHPVDAALKFGGLLVHHGGSAKQRGKQVPISIHVTT